MRRLGLLAAALAALLAAGRRAWPRLVFRLPGLVPDRPGDEFVYWAS